MKFILVFRYIIISFTQLMVQIDSLISGCRQEWEKSVRALQTQLQQRDRDIAALKVQLRERHAQVDTSIVSVPCD